MIDFHIIIPARLQSTRLPEKLLKDIKGKTLIERVHDRALLCGAKSVVIATDDDNIEQTAKSFGAKVCRTKPIHINGSERLAEASTLLNLKPEDIVVGLQGDEPLVPIEAVHQIVQRLYEHSDAFMTTLCCPIKNVNDLHNPNVVKLVLDKDSNAIYFSRSLIPYPRDIEMTSDSFDTLYNLNTSFPFYRHIGLYAYRVRSLLRYQDFPSPLLESLEKLEQLRILWQGEHIQVAKVDKPLPPGVDTLEELEFMRTLF